MIWLIWLLFLTFLFFVRSIDFFFHSQLGPNQQVTQVKLPETDGYCALQLGAGERKLKRLNRAQVGHFAASGVTPKQVLSEFRVTPEAVLPTGTSFSVHHFLVGQYLDITGISKGKGFAGYYFYFDFSSIYWKNTHLNKPTTTLVLFCQTGVMKRHGFSGGVASHGNSLSHRVPGSTGNQERKTKHFFGIEK